MLAFSFGNLPALLLEYFKHALRGSRVRGARLRLLYNSSDIGYSFYYQLSGD